MENLYAFWARIKSPLNKFWKRIRLLAISVFTSSTAVLMLNGQDWITVPDNIINIMTILAWVSAFIAGTSQLTKK